MSLTNTRSTSCRPDTSDFSIHSPKHSILLYQVTRMFSIQEHLRRVFASRPIEPSCFPISLHCSSNTFPISIQHLYPSSLHPIAIFLGDFIGCMKLCCCSSVAAVLLGGSFVRVRFSGAQTEPRCVIET